MNARRIPKNTVDVRTTHTGRDLPGLNDNLPVGFVSRRTMNLGFIV